MWLEPGRDHLSRQIDLHVEGLKTLPQLDSQPKPKHVTL
jgi:hypothetical protein